MAFTNLMFAAGLFDSPWVIAAIVIIGAFINWLSQLREQKRQREEERRAREGQPESPQKPSFDVEEALRRLLGEEPPRPTPMPPPILPRPAGSPSSPPPLWQGRPVPPVLAPPSVAVALPVELARVQQQATARLAGATGHVPQHQVSEGRGRRRTGRWSGWGRDRASVRRAFVGSLVFGPPKGLES